MFYTPIITIIKINYEKYTLNTPIMEIYFLTFLFFKSFIYAERTTCILFIKSHIFFYNLYNMYLRSQTYDSLKPRKSKVQ